jgi:protocatechuate 3,4-dioxygenase, beta subunit
VAHEVRDSGLVVGYRRESADPPYLHPDYVATRTRAPKRPLVVLPHTLSEVTGPLYGHERVGELDHDLTRQHEGEPLGERIIVHGRVLDGDRRPVPNTLIELWQANAAGRYRHQVDVHPATLDRNFSGAGRCLTDSEGQYGARPPRWRSGVALSRYDAFDQRGPALPGHGLAEVDWR